MTGKVSAELFNTSDSPRSGSYIEKMFDLHAEGQLKFNYVFVHGSGTNVSAEEKAFWVVLDGNGNVYKSALITGASPASSGVITVPVEHAGKYTLILGCYDTATAVQGNTMPQFYVDQVVYAPANASDIYHGNMIEDKSPLGETDILAENAVLHKIVINGTEYSVADTFHDGQLILGGVFRADDKLTVNATGDYTYQVPRDTPFDNVNIEYVLKESGSSDTDRAMLYIRSEA